MLIKLVVSVTILTCVVARSADFLRDLDIDDSASINNNAFRNIESDLVNVAKNVHKRKVFGRDKLSTKDVLKRLLETVEEIKEFLMGDGPPRPRTSRKPRSSGRPSGKPKTDRTMPPHTKEPFTGTEPPHTRTKFVFHTSELPSTYPVKRGMYYRSDLGETLQDINKIVKDIREKVRVL